MIARFRPLLDLTFCAMTVMIPSVSFSHARLKPTPNIIVPRSTDPGVKTAPCGTYPRSNTPAVLTAGQTITVTWEETVQHPGRFEFYFSSTGTDTAFTLLKTVNDTQDGAIASPADYHQYSTQLTLPPNVTCNACTLQMIQVMTENPANPSYYYSCADMKLMPSASPTPAPTSTPSPTPIASPPKSQDCP